MPIHGPRSERGSLGRPMSQQSKERRSARLKRSPQEQEFEMLLRRVSASLKERRPGLLRKARVTRGRGVSAA